MPPNSPAKAGKPVTVLVCGASQMGKSYLSERVLVEEFKASCFNIDALYSRAVVHAGMSPSRDNELDPSLVSARRAARDRKWPTPKARDDFFAFYAEQVRKAIGSSSLVAFDGGTLGKPEEVELILSESRGRTTIRLCVEAAYPRWLQNRVRQAAERHKETLKVKDITPEGFQAARKRSRPAPHPAIVDYPVADVADVREILRSILP